MSVSREKKTRQGETAQVTPAQARAQKRQQEEQAARRSMALYTAVGAVCVLLAVVVLVWNSGLIHRTVPAATVDGVNYSAADVEYYYNSARSSILNLYRTYFGSAPFDTNTSTRSQVYNAETGETWYDQLMSQAMETMADNTTLAAQARAEGYTLSQEGQESLDQFLSDLETAWTGSGYSSRDAFLRGNYGAHITYNRFVELLTQDLLAEDYAAAQRDALTYTDGDYETYYGENKDDLDTFTVTQFLFQVDADAFREDDGEEEMTDDERTAALERGKAELKPLAEQLKTQLEAGEDPAALAEQYDERLNGTLISQTMTGSSLPAGYSEWACAAARRSGDITLKEYDTGTGSTFNYYVVRFEGRERDETPTRDVRHILVAAETDEGADQPSDAQYAEAREKAQELLDQWKAGEATEDSFAALARENSADTGSAGNGGLISGVTADSGYVQTFTDWTMDPARKPGDTGLVQNTGSSTKGWHVMYYVGPGDPVWKQTADSALRSEDYSVWREETLEGHEAQQGFAMRFISA